jgi:NADPH:quinone reductase-like Zn-dependent oxidoreductase
MKAMVYTEYGSPDGLRLVDVPKPAPSDDELLIRVHAVSINGSDREALEGRPAYTRIGGLRRPRHHVLGSDIAGRVEAVGRNVRAFRVGDEVFGEMPGYHGGFTEYVCVPEKAVALKPASLTFAEASTLPQAGAIALHGIIKKGQVQAGQKVLINGAGGSGGVFAVQLARSCGAEVTAVDNAGKLDFLRSLGADHVIDHAAEDFTRGGAKYDLILDLFAHRSIFACARALRPGGSYLCVGGAVAVLFQSLLIGPWIRRAYGKTLRLLIVPQFQDLVAVAELAEAGRLRPQIDREYPLAETADALRHVVAGRHHGKVVITIV